MDDVSNSCDGLWVSIPESVHPGVPRKLANKTQDSHRARPSDCVLTALPLVALIIAATAFTAELAGRACAFSWPKWTRPFISAEVSWFDLHETASASLTRRSILHHGVVGLSLLSALLQITTAAFNFPSKPEILFSAAMVCAEGVRSICSSSVDMATWRHCRVLSSF